MSMLVFILEEITRRNGDLLYRATNYHDIHQNTPFHNQCLSILQKQTSQGTKLHAPVNPSDSIVEPTPTSQCATP